MRAGCLNVWPDCIRSYSTKWVGSLFYSQPLVYLAQTADITEILLAWVKQLLVTINMTVSGFINRWPQRVGVCTVMLTMWTKTINNQLVHVVHCYKICEWAPRTAFWICFKLVFALLRPKQCATHIYILNVSVQTSCIRKPPHSGHQLLLGTHRNWHYPETMIR